nr:retrovirus-related Pol polyprotein from transposon TNT 1-94 [Tanacetum cinerariifolium]
MKNIVELQPRNVNKKNRVVEPICNVDVKQSRLNANSELICATCKKSMFDGVHDLYILDFVKNMNSRAKSAKKHKNKIFGNVRVMYSPKYDLSGNQQTELLLYLTLCEFYANVGISHQTYVARTPQQNGVVERQNQTLVEAARTMLIFYKALLFLRAEAIKTTCYIQNRSIIRRRYNKTSYELMQDKKLDLSFFHVFGALCYPTNDNDDLGKLDAKDNIVHLIGWSSVVSRVSNTKSEALKIDGYTILNEALKIDGYTILNEVGTAYRGNFLGVRAMFTVNQTYLSFFIFITGSLIVYPAGYGVCRSKSPKDRSKTKKDVEVESSKRKDESLEQEIAKKQKMKEDTDELKKHLQIVVDDDDDVYTDATPLA